LFIDAEITGITHVSAELEMIITRYNSFLGSSYDGCQDWIAFIKTLKIFVKLLPVAGE